MNPSTTAERRRPIVIDHTIGIVNCLATLAEAVEITPQEYLANGARISEPIEKICTSLLMVVSFSGSRPQTRIGGTGRKRVTPAMPRDRSSAVRVVVDHIVSALHSLLGLVATAGLKPNDLSDSGGMELEFAIRRLCAACNIPASFAIRHPVSEVRLCGTCGRPNPVPPREEWYEIVEEGPLRGLPKHPDIVYRGQGWGGWCNFLHSDECCNECGAELPPNAKLIN